MNRMQGLPSNVEMEKFVLGGCFVDEPTMGAARNVLERDDFSIEKHRRIWHRACEVYDGGCVVNYATVANDLRRHGELESCGGISYLVDLDTNMPTLFDLNSFIQILNNFKAWRRVIEGTENAQQRCFAQEPVEDILESMSAVISGVSKIHDHSGPIFARDAIDQIGFDQLLVPRQERGIRLPWFKLNNELAGLHPEEVTVIAAHTSGGKTSMAPQIGMHAAAQNVGVLIFSLEMSKEALLRRMIRQRARVTDFKDLDTDRRDQVRDAAHWIYHAPIAFDESAQTVPAMHASIRTLKRNGIGLVIVDYLQLIRGMGRHDNRVQEISANSRALKLVAKEFRIPFVVLSQFNRDSAKEGRPPELYDLKGCGDIENDSDNVLFIHPTSKGEDELVPVDVIVAKQREGPRNLAVSMLFDMRYQRLDPRAGDAE